jgi:hypothetical protein
MSPKGAGEICFFSSRSKDPADAQSCAVNVSVLDASLRPFGTPFSMTADSTSSWACGFAALCELFLLFFRRPDRRALFTLDPPPAGSEFRMFFIRDESKGGGLGMKNTHFAPTELYFK